MYPLALPPLLGPDVAPPLTPAAPFTPAAPVEP